MTSSLDNLRAAAPCARLLFMAPVAIGSSDWRTTSAACAPLHYLASGGFCWCAPSPCHFGRPCTRVAASALRHLALGSERERLQPASAPGTLAHTSAAPGSAWLLLLAAARLLLLAAHYCYSWLRTAFSFRPRYSMATVTAAPYPRQHQQHLVGYSSTWQAAVPSCSFLTPCGSSP
ncbi:unnamed protein product [Closterium sp. NIES-64]|nr:unnamed protein product [Closterium sp. NIES-64]